MTTGYLWDGQFQELKKVLEEGQPHSMELDTNSLDGHWAKDNNLGVEFFIINDAVFSKLCILGDDVEPCFEGSSVTATSSEVQKTFSANQEFSRTLFNMMNELTDAIQSKGGLEMPNEFAEQTETVEETSTEFSEVTEEVTTEEPVDYTEAEEAPAAEAEGQFEKKDDDKDDSEKSDDAASDSGDKDDDEDDDEKKKPASKNSLEEYEALKEEVETLRAEIETLREFKLTVENEQKDALMDSWPYNTLSDEDKADVIAHKSEYSLDEIKAKLAVIYVEKGVQFAAEETKEEESAEEAITTFSLDGEVAEVESDLQRALRETRKY